MRKAGWSLLATVLLVFGVAFGAAEEKRHVVILVWDGMRPDLVTPRDAPNLCKLREEGVWFENHHAVYLSATHVNGTAIETGCYPSHSGLLVNYEYRPEIDSEKFVSTEQKDIIRKGDKLSAGKYLERPTVAELVRAAGGKTVVAAAKSVGFLLDRQPDRDKAQFGVTLSSGDTLPKGAVGQIVSVAGLFPAFAMYSHEDRDLWTTQALTDSLWKDGIPEYSVLWLGQPDMSQHETAAGSPQSRAGIKSSDENLGRVLRALEKKGARASTDVFVVSDHGFSTVQQPIDVRKFLVEAGFHILLDAREETPKRGDVFLVGNGGSFLCYVVERDPDVTKRLVEVLQKSPFAGVIFAREALPGTFTLDKVNLAHERGPDLVIASRWNDRKNEFGVAGMIFGDWNRPESRGTHASLSRFDMHNTLVAAGPDFRKGFRDALPTGNTDLAPTVLQILGITPPAMDGRVLSEALVKAPASDQLRADKRALEASVDLASGKWQQTLKISQVGSTIYFDEGNGSFTPKK